MERLSAEWVACACGEVLAARAEVAARNASTDPIVCPRCGRLYPDSRMSTDSTSGDDGRLLTADRRVALATPSATSERAAQALAGQWLLGHTTAVAVLGFSPNGKVLASSAVRAQRAKAELGKASEVKLWSVAQAAEQCTLRGHKDSVLDLAFSADGNRLYTASRDGTLGIWDVTPGLYDVVFGTRIHTLRLGTAAITSVACSGDGRWIATGEDAGPIKVWDAQTLKLEKTLRGARGGAARVQFSPDGLVLAGIWASRGEVQLWSVGKFEEEDALRLRRDEDHPDQALAFSPGGNLAVLSDDELRVWDLSSRQVLFSVPNRMLRGMAFSHDSRVLATAVAESASGEGLVCYHGLSGSPLASISTGARGLLAVACSPREDLLVGGANSGTVQLWQYSA